MNIRSLFGDRAFYKNLLAVSVPIIVQNAITNFISLLDNVMVGQIGTEQMSGVSIVNQLLFVFNLCIFGAVSGAGLFGAQFFGKRDHEGIRHTFRFKLISCVGLCTAALLVLVFLQDPLIRLYLHEGGETGDLELTFRYAKDYLAVALFGLLPYTVTQVYAATLREIRHTVPPMTAGIIGVVINLTLNYFLIFGKCGFPEMGVAGAALATVISRFAEALIVILWTHLHKDACPFIVGAYRSLHVPKELIRRILITGTPLMLNETLWAAGQAAVLQCYSFRGIAVVSAMNISNIISNTFSVLYLSVGTAISILLGHHLGAGDRDGALKNARKMICFSFFMGILASLLIAASAPFFPKLYNTTGEVRTLATSLAFAVASAAPLQSMLNGSYYTLRSGGKTVLTFLFDSAYVWCVTVPLTFCLSHFSPLPTVAVYLICLWVDILKTVFGIVLVNKGIWLNNMTDGAEQES